MTCADEEVAFLAAVRSEPDDDTVRLVYADWLDEHHAVEVPCGNCNGKPRIYSFKPPTSTNWIQVRASTYECLTCGGSGVIRNTNRERAEFVRLEIELAKAAFDSQPRSKFDRRDELLAAHEYEWRGEPLNGTVPLVGHRRDYATQRAPVTRRLYAISAYWTRGFVSRVEMLGDDWYAYARPLTIRHPIEFVSLVGAPPLYLGPVEEKEGYDAAMKARTVAARWWVEGPGLPREQVDLSYAISDRELSARGNPHPGREVVLGRQEFDRAVAKARRPESVLRTWWPKIVFDVREAVPDFDLPPPPYENYTPPEIMDWPSPNVGSS